jgi:hypothetical protein
MGFPVAAPAGYSGGKVDFIRDRRFDSFAEPRGMIQRYRCLIEEWCLEDDCLV